MKKRAFMIFMTLATLGIQGANANPNIDVQKEAATVEEKRFDPEHLPDPPPPVPYGLKAVTHYDFHCYATAHCDWVDEGTNSGANVKAKVKLSGLSVKLRLPLTIWLPIGHSEHLRDHELGHTRIDTHIYENADRAAEQVGQELLGQEFTGTGRDLDEARSNAITVAIDEFCKRYHEITKGMAEKLNDRYDHLTNHGRNDFPVERAIEQVYSEAKSASLKRSGGGII